MTESQREAIIGILAYFESSNGVPVDKATIRANSQEVKALRKALEEPVQEPMTNEENLRNIVDQAGKLMSERNLVWVDHQPAERVVPMDGATPPVLFSFCVGITPYAAAEMNWELSERIAEMEIDSNGFGVDFVGIN